MTAPITNVFVLMLENRSFDHMLGFSGLTGTDAVTGLPTSIDGLTGKESNSYEGTPYLVSQPADQTMPVDPGHEFLDVLAQLCGPGSTYTPGGAYPPITSTGFVADYAVSPSPGEGNAPGNFGEIMKCYSPAQLPVLTTLAQSFAVCDGWCSSLPGPTWPNRFFLQAASSGGLDHSPTTEEILGWQFSGFQFPNGSIFDALNTLPSGFGWKIFADGPFTVVGALKGITASDIESFDDFLEQVAMSSYPWPYTFIEPDYGDVASGTYEGGSSQHPLDDVSSGEALIKATYEAIRQSPHWATSLLIVTWDEHGGFFDHVAPGGAVAPGDGASSEYNQYGFTFEQYGVRVPAVVVSPLIPAGIIDHRTYDHASVPATIESLFGLAPLTQRDAKAASVVPLLSLSTPRTDAPWTLPDPVDSTEGRAFSVRRAARLLRTARPASNLRPPAAPSPDDAPIESGSLPGFLYVAAKHDAELSPPETRAAPRARLATIRTRGQARQYLAEVEAKIRAARASR